MKRILWLNDKTYGGGAGKLYATAKAMLAHEGAQVAPFFGSFRDEEVEPEFRPFQPQPLADTAYLGFIKRAIGDADVIRRLELFRTYFRPDTVVVQNCNKYLSPEVIAQVAAWGIPVILLINDYGVYCSNAYAWRRGSICHACKDQRFARSVWLGCANRGGLQGAAQMASRAWALNLAWRRDAYGAAGAYLTAGKKFAGRLTEAGFNPDKIVTGIFPHTVTGEEDRSALVDDRLFVYYGSDLPLKGQETLLAAMKFMPADARLKLFVLKPSEQLRRAVAMAGESVASRVKLVDDKMWGTGVRQEVSRAAAVVVPSLWEGPHELVVYEAMALGRPVIVSDVSSNAELVENGVNGHIFNTHSPADLARAMMHYYGQPDYTRQVGRRAAAFYDARLRPKYWYPFFRQAYELASAAIERRSSAPQESRI